MRMEEISEGRYQKNTDTVERYLLNLVEQYFKNSNVASSSSREYIIQKAVQRMKEEVDFDAIGVLSITIPGDTAPRTGAVSISLEDLGGEPEITSKLSAFNVSFGDKQNTACEGNDPRLTDKRVPLSHIHEISDINGLEGTLSTLVGRIERLGGFVHEHSNMSVLDKLTYSGSKTSIDLYDLEKLKDKVDDLIQQIRDDIVQYKTDMQDKINEIRLEIQNIENDISTLEQWVVDKCNDYLTQANNYTNTEITNAQTTIQNELNLRVKRNDINDLIDISSNSLSLVGTMNINLDSLVLNSGNNNTSIEESVPSDIIAELTNRNVLLKDANVEILFKYTSGGEILYTPVPYVFFKNNTMDGSLHAGINNVTQKIKIMFTSNSGNIPSEIGAGSIVVNIYSKKPVVVP